MRTQILLSVFTALSASMCCITPVLAITAGTTGVASSLHWMEPLRPYFISASVLVLGFAWFKSFTAKNEDDCDCETPKRRPFLKSRTFLGLVTLLSFLLIMFPSYSRFLLDEATQEQTTAKKIELMVTGMTCTSCELEIESEVKKLPGVVSVKASYEKGTTKVEYDEQKTDAAKIIAAINSTGYEVQQGQGPIPQVGKGGNCCANGTCKDHVGTLPKEENRNLRVLTGMGEMQTLFNQQSGKTKFVAILSSTCGWCLQGAGSIQKAIVENMRNKNVSVVIVWTNMLKTDDQTHAYRAASLFMDPNIVQYFDSENRFGELVAKRLNPQGKKAWDIYMFFDKETVWTKELPRPFEYAHQLNSEFYPWVDKTKYFCSEELTKRLNEIVATL